MTCLVGVDSGGTHTNIRLVATDGSAKTITEIDRSLTSNRSDRELEEVVTRIFAAVGSHALGEHAAAWINAAGYSASTRVRFERLIRSAANGFMGPIGICNDGVGLLMAHDAELVTVIAGTGSVALARDSTGAVVTRGGDEWVAADYGSAFWLGLQGIRAAYEAFQGGPETSLLSSLTAHFSPFKAQDVGSTVSAIARTLASLGTDTKPTIALFAPEVTGQAEKGDDVSQKIVRSAVDELAAAAARVYRELASRAQPRLVLPRFLVSGSVAYSSRFYYEAFSASLDQFLFNVRETSGRPIDIDKQLNGLSEAVELARGLAEGNELPALDERHPYSIVASE